MHCPFSQNTGTQQTPSVQPRAGAPGPHVHILPRRRSLLFQALLLMTTHVCWIWAAEKTRCRLDHLRVNCSDNRCSNVLRPAQGASVVSREQNKVAVYFQAEGLAFVSFCASGNLGNKGGTCVSWKKKKSSPTSIVIITRQSPLQVRKSRMLAREYLQLIVS